MNGPSYGKLREEYSRQKDSMLEDPEAGKVWAHHEKSVHQLNQESKVRSESKEDS